MTTGRKTTLVAMITTALLLAVAWSSGPRAEEPAPTPIKGALAGPSQRNRYADGVYTATGQYGNEPSFITVTATLANGMITDVKATPHATVPRSLELQRRFAAAVPKVVVGKPIDQMNVGKLAGSSGTPRGFNAAIRQIREQAKR
jgi:uncharacterized protein with FMN-binding domain